MGRSHDTGAAQQRTLEFTDVAGLRAELSAIERAFASGTLSHTGRWTPAMILNHLAAWAEYPWKGFPPELRAPWLIRLLFSRQKKKFGTRAGRMRPGVRIPGIAGGTLGADDGDFSRALQRYVAATDLLNRNEAPPHPSPAFGRLSADEYRKLNLHHAELHLSFLTY